MYSHLGFSRPLNLQYVLYFRFENILSFNGKGILLIRNPFKAIQSWYRHLQNGVHSDTDYKDQEKGTMSKMSSNF